MIDKKAVKILFKRYWSSSGWTDTYLSKMELDYAKKAGIMFEPAELSHDDLIKQIADLTKSLNLKDVSQQFIASLSTRRLDLRSALGSYIIGKNLPVHPFTGEEQHCEFCGGYNKTREKQDLNVLNFERFKWGGVRHLDPMYIAFDLQQFANTEKLVPTAEDYEILKKILETIQEFPTQGKIRDLEKALKTVLRSNKEEREVLLQTLGYCSILAADEHPGFMNEFVPFGERELPSHSKNDWDYPVCWWTGKSGLNREAAKLIFPEAMLL